MEPNFVSLLNDGALFIKYIPLYIKQINTVGVDISNFTSKIKINYKNIDDSSCTWFILLLQESTSNRYIFWPKNMNKNKIYMFRKRHW